MENSLKISFTMIDRVAERHPHFSKFIGLFTYSPIHLFTSSLAFTTANRLSRTYTLGCKPAFTMAEILISLTIIGVIAAITLPSLQANINEKTWATQRKALYSRMSQAISLMDSLNGYGVVRGQNGINVTQTAQNATQAFITDGLSKFLKINNICNYSNFNKCGISSKIKKLDNSTLTTPLDFYEMNRRLPNNIISNFINTKAAAFETNNGESFIAYYNPNCTYFNVDNIDYTLENDEKNDILPSVCINFVFDLNGKKGPNKVGKDIGYMTVLSPVDSEVITALPYGKVKYFQYNNAASYCKSLGSDYRLPTVYELAALHTNNVIIYNEISNRYWSATKAKSGLPITLYMTYGRLRTMGTNHNFRVQCVKR